MIFVLLHGKKQSSFNNNYYIPYIIFYFTKFKHIMKVSKTKDYKNIYLIFVRFFV